MTKEADIHDLMVENNFKYHFEINDSIREQSLFIKKVSNNAKFSANRIYMGTRMCNSDFYGSIEETIVFYVSSVDEKNNTLKGFVVYYELKPFNTDKYFIEKYYPPYAETLHNITINNFSNISVKCKKYIDPDLQFDDETCINISSKNETDLKGWWLNNSKHNSDNLDL